MPVIFWTISGASWPEAYPAPIPQRIKPAGWINKPWINWLLLKNRQGRVDDFHEKDTGDGWKEL